MDSAKVRLCGSKTEYMKIGICTPLSFIFQFLLPLNKNGKCI